MIPNIERRVIMSPNLSEIPDAITLGSYDEIERSRKYVESLKDGYADCFPMGGFQIGTRRIVPHGEIYQDLLKIPNVRRLFKVRQLGMIGVFSGTGTDGQMDMCSYQNRADHSFDVSIRMEISCGLDGFDEDEINLAIASGALHDIYTPAFSEHGKFVDPEKLDEEKNIRLILSNQDIMAYLKKFGINPHDVIYAVKGSYPVIGAMLNSSGLDVDQIAYTIMDSDHVHYLTACPDQTDLFIGYRLDPAVRDLHESISNDGKKVFFMEPHAVRKMLYLQAWLYKNHYLSGSNRAREVCLQNELKKHRAGKVTAEQVMKMEDWQFEDFLKEINDKLYSRFQSVDSDSFQEIARIRDASEEEVRKEYGGKFLVKKQGRFNPGTSTLLKKHRDVVPFFAEFPQDAQTLEDIADSCEYIGVYRADL